MHFQEVDRAPWWEMWYWAETIERWQEEGLPKDVHLQEYFGVDRRENVGVNLGLIPPFEETTLEETDTYRVYIDGNGVTRKEFKEHGRSTMPQWLRFPVENRADFENLKERLNPDSPCRYPLWWEDRKRYWKDRDYPLSITAGSLFGGLRGDGSTRDRVGQLRGSAEVAEPGESRSDRGPRDVADRGNRLGDRREDGRRRPLFRPA